MQPLIGTTDKGLPLGSFKERMTYIELSERVLSTSPTGSWLEGLRASFEPDPKPARAGDPKPH